MAEVERWPDTCCLTALMILTDEPVRMHNLMACRSRYIGPSPSPRRQWQAASTPPTDRKSWRRRWSSRTQLPGECDENYWTTNRQCLSSMWRTKDCDWKGKWQKQREAYRPCKLAFGMRSTCEVEALESQGCQECVHHLLRYLATWSNIFRCK